MNRFLIAAWLVGLIVFIGGFTGSIRDGEMLATLGFLLLIMISVGSTQTRDAKARALQAKEKLDRQTGIL
jgi:hypothetical protein